MLQASGLHFSRDCRAIIQDVSLTLSYGQVTAVIGPNGAGKSTLLHLLSGALSPDKGVVTLDERALAAWSPGALARRRAVLPQFSELSFPFRALEVVLMGRSAHSGRSSRERDLEIAVSALTEVDAGHLANRVYPTLSGGERQRVQLARAMAQVWPDPDENHGRYLLLDEPTNNLDLSHQHRLLTFALRLAQKGMGVLAVLHDPNLAALYGDRIVMLVNGRVQIDGSVDAVLTRDHIETAFDLRVEIHRHPSRDRPQLIAV